MQRHRLGRTGLTITPIGFGAWAIGGGGYAFGWGPQDDRDSIATLHRALDLGMNWIDTAAVYGLGHSEEIVARALAERGSSRRPYVFTKGSMTWDGAGQIRHSLKAASLRREVENSLRRLGVETIDLYQIHWPGFPPPARPSEDVEEGWRALADMRREGKLRHIGVSNFEVPELERLEAIAPVETLQPPYSLLRRQAERELLPYCQAHDIGVIVYSPMQSGLLTGRMTRERIASLPDDDWRKGNAYFQEPRLSRALEVVEVLRTVGARYDRAPGEIAIAWTLRHPAVTAAIVGARRPDQVDGIIGAADLRLSDTDVAEIEQALA